MLQFTLTGRLAADPDMTTYGSDNIPMARLRVASNQPGSDRTDFFDVAVFGDGALQALSDARKGDKVQLKGNARQSTWTTDSGERRHSVSLAARFVEHTPHGQTTPAGSAVDNVQAASTTSAQATPAR